MQRRRALARLAGAAAAACGSLRAHPARAAAVGQRTPAAALAARALRRSDVVFMYEASAETYAAYGATVLAWGGRPDPAKLTAAAGVAWHGSVGMVTEFAEYHRSCPRSWAEGLCRDVHGQPMKVPWLTDHQHEGEPYWWCCTRQPQFRRFLEERVATTLKAGAVGLHVDDHLGTAGALFLGACFCALCVAGFREHLRTLEPSRREPLGLLELASFDYGAVLRKWLADCRAGETRKVQDHPLWREWSVYQLRSAAVYMRHLRHVAERAVGRAVPVSANAGLLWPNHLADFHELDYLSAETEHQAEAHRLSDRPLFAYRLADAVRRPYAATASGQDWALVKEHGLSGLVTGWIALAYAAGHQLMAPHRQWCYTPERGTHWYEGPARAYAPFFRFVRENASCFDGHEAWCDIAVVMPHRSWVEGREKWLALGERLAAANLSYRVVIGSDEVVECAVGESDFDGVQAILVPDPDALRPSERAVVERATSGPRGCRTVEQAISRVRPKAALQAEAPVRVLPRVARDSLVVHLLNMAYEPRRDAFPELTVHLRIDRVALGVAAQTRRCRVLAPGRAPLEVPLAADGRLSVELTGPWMMLQLARG